jgi:tetratricopeptide (TPR) repeat protein
MNLYRPVLALWLAAALAACGGPFKDAVKRGDQYSEAGMWDKAEAEYQAALKLEPGDTDVQIKLKKVREKKSGEHLARGKALLARGEIEAGLAVIQQAAQLAPDNTEAQRALTDANAQALNKAEELLSTPDSRKAFDLTQLVLAGSPNDPRAKSVDESVRDTLAEQSYAAAEQFRDKGKKGNALMEYAACVTYRPGFRDAKAQIGEVKLALQNELMYYVVLDKVGAEAAGEKAIAALMKPELVGQAFDDRIPLRVVAAPPGKEARGVRVTGALSAYRFGPPKSATRNEGCEYIKGYDIVPNPRRADAERQLASAEQRLTSAERDVDQQQKEIDRYQEQVDREQQELAREESDLDKARENYDRCMSKSSSSSSSSTPCWSEKSSMESAQRDVESERRDVSNRSNDLRYARERMSSASDRRNSARRDVEDYRARMRQEPETIKEPHRERENFTVETRSIDAAVTLKLRAETLGDKQTLLNDEMFPQVIKPIVDEGWKARPATCPESGKNIQLPNEQALRGELLKMTIATVREKVQSMYGSYRTKFLADARRLETGGVPEDAVESYVRYLLTGLRNIDPKDGKQIGEFLRKTRGFGRIDLLGGL